MKNVPRKCVKVVMKMPVVSQSCPSGSSWVDHCIIQEIDVEEIYLIYLSGNLESCFYGNEGMKKF